MNSSTLRKSWYCYCCKLWQLGGGEGLFDSLLQKILSDLHFLEGKSCCYATGPTKHATSVWISTFHLNKYCILVFYYSQILFLVSILQCYLFSSMFILHEGMNTGRWTEHLHSDSEYPSSIIFWDFSCYYRNVTTLIHQTIRHMLFWNKHTEIKSCSTLLLLRSTFIALLSSTALSATMSFLFPISMRQMSGDAIWERAAETVSSIGIVRQWLQVGCYYSPTCGSTVAKQGIVRQWLQVGCYYSPTCGSTVAKQGIGTSLSARSEPH